MSIPSPSQNMSYAGVSQPHKYKGLKADPHSANGGIGISYSNVMLGGVNSIADSGQHVPHSTYRNAFVRNGTQDAAQRVSTIDPDEFTNQTHKNRFMSPAKKPITYEQNTPANKIAYVKGVDFNSQ